MIKGVFFDPHAMERAEDRTGLTDFDKDYFEQKIIDLDGELYYDHEYDNYQMVLEDVVFAFDLRLHENRPGLLAYVRTALPVQQTFRDQDNRFERLRPQDINYCERCGIPLKNINHQKQQECAQIVDAE